MDQLDRMMLRVLPNLVHSMIPQLAQILTSLGRSKARSGTQGLSDNTEGPIPLGAEVTLVGYQRPRSPHSP